MKKKIVSMAMVFAMIAALAIGGTLAYFTDTDSAVNTFTVGKVEITQNEKDRDGNDYVNGENGKKLYPIVGSAQEYDENGLATGENYIDKLVTVTVGKDSEDAYVRTFLAFPAALDDGPTAFDASANILHWNAASASDGTEKVAAHKGYSDANRWYFGYDTTDDWPNNGGAWNGYVATIDGVDYNVYIATHKIAVPAGETTTPSLLGVYLDANVDFDTENEYYVDQKGNKIPEGALENAKVLVFSQAVQAQGFDATKADVAFEALKEAFGNPGDATFECPFGGINVKAFSAYAE